MQSLLRIVIRDASVYFLGYIYVSLCARDGVAVNESKHLYCRKIDAETSLSSQIFNRRRLCECQFDAYR